MKKKIISFFVILFLLIACVSCEKKNQGIVDGVIDSNNPQNLQILRSDLKLTQEQVMSQMKADNIKKNNGYVDNDEIITLIQLEDEALIDSYINTYSDKSDSDRKSVV